MPTDRTRWMALYVLCAGVLMIVIDATIVNVALPSIQEDLGFSQSNLAWVVNAYLIAFGGLLLLAGRIGDLIGQRRIFLIGLAVFTVASLLCAVAQTPGDADRRALRPGRRRRARLGGDPGHDRDDVPGAPGAGEGDRRLRVRGVRGRLDRPARRRRADRGDQLALDLLHQRADRHRDGAAGAAAGRASRRARPQGRRRRPRRRPAHGRADARRLHDPRGARAGLGIDPDARARRRVDRAGRRVRGAPGAHPQSADAAAPVPLAYGRRSEPGPGAAGRRDVRDVLPRRPLHAADPRLRPARGRARVPAGDDRHGRDVAALLGAADPPLRSAGTAARRPREHRSSACCCSRARRSTAASSSTSRRR